MSFYPWFPELYYKQSSHSFWAARIQHWSVRHQWIMYVFVYMDRVHRVQSTYICRFTYTYTLKNLFQSSLWKKIEGKTSIQTIWSKLAHVGGVLTAGAIVCPLFLSLHLPHSAWHMFPVPCWHCIHNAPHCVFFLCGSQIAALLFISIYVRTTLYPAYHPLTGPCQWALIFIFFFYFFFPVHGFLNWFLFGKWQCPSDMTYFFQAVLAGCSTPS